MNTLYLSLLAIQEGLQTKGWVVTISGFCIVVIALIVLYLVFSGLLKLLNMDIFKKDKKEDKVEVAGGNNIDKTTDDDVMAAIAMALSLSMSDGVHDVESDIITIKRVERRNSPWCTRIYGMNNII